MYLYVEMWNVTKKWLKLSTEERRGVFNKMDARIGELKALGVENLGWARNDEHTPYRSDYRYLCVWQMPSVKEAEILEDNLKKAGWYTYFSQVNSRGEVISRDHAKDFLINLKETSTSFLDS